MKKEYRKGGVGAMMDEYERAAETLKSVIEHIPEEDFDRILDTETKDDDCRSIQTIIYHVVRAGYGYADYFRDAFGMSSARPENVPVGCQEAAEKIDAMLVYTAQTLEGKWQMSDEEIQAVQMKVSWGVTYDLEQLLEHAIVHILRHRRQIERFLLKMAE